MARRQTTLNPAAMQDAQEKYGYFSAFIVHDDTLYQEIANALTRRDGTQNNPAFLEMFEAELSRITDYVIGQHEYQERSAKALLANAFTVVDRASANSNDLLLGLRHQANDQLQLCLKLRRFAKKNTEILSEIAQYADSQLGSTCSVLLRHQQRRFPDADSALTVLFSDIYATIHAAETNQEAEGDKWVAPSTFERTTTKYWVKEDDLAEVLLLASSEAPLLVYGRNGRLTTKADCLVQQSKGEKLWENLVTPISSVYFDSAKLDLYKSRIVRDEGSQLLRARWYGTKPEGKQPIFLELKTHHEKWVNSKSVKERVSIQAQDMDAFLSSAQWTFDEALTVVTPVNPTLSDVDLEKAADLLLTMHNMVVDLGLRPCVRSVYKRAAFQSAQSNSLRLTVDRGVALVNESSKSASRGSWCLSDEDCASGSNMVKHVPFAIFEVKLSSSDMPDAIQAMEEQGIIVTAPKFSKFLTGVASFNSNKIAKLPYWADHPAFAPLFDSLAMPELDENNFLESTVASSETGRSPPVSEGSKQGSVDNNRNFKQGQNKSTLSRLKKTKKIARAVPKARVRVEPKSYFANERTFIQWISGALLLATVSAIILDLQTTRESSLMIGFALVVCGAIVVCYATFVYFRRLRLLASGSPYGYIDRVGPLILACSVLIGVGVLSFYYLERAGLIVPGIMQHAIYSQSEVCTQRSLQGISLLEYQPSDIVVDTARDLLLVPSLSKITGLSYSAPNEPLKMLADVPGGADLECLTYVGDRLFAVSEGQSGSLLIEFEWDMNDVLVQVQQLQLPTLNVEGIAFVPDEGDSADGNLYVAGDSGNVKGIVDVYRVPSAPFEGASTGPMPVLRRSRHLNNNLITQGLLDSKIAALTYFEDVLYILHDNAQVIRAWNIEEGKLLSEIQLPFVEGGFEKQWEGLALERRQVAAGSSNLRDVAVPQTSLLLHLTLDSPPEIWTLAIKEGAINGKLVLPDCAV